MGDVSFVLFGVAAVFVLSLPGVALALLLRTPKKARRAALTYALINGLSVAAVVVSLILAAAAYDENGLSLAWLCASALIPFALCFGLTAAILTLVFRRRAQLRP